MSPIAPRSRRVSRQEPDVAVRGHTCLPPPPALPPRGPPVRPSGPRSRASYGAAVNAWKRRLPQPEPPRMRLRGYTRPRWICTSSGRSRRPPSEPPWTPSSGRPSRAGSAGRATRGIDGHAARGGHAIAGPTLAAAAGPPRRPVADRLDQPAGAQLRLQAAGGRRRPRPTASPRSTPCSRRSRGRRSWPTSATTSPAGWPARRDLRGPDAGPRAGRRAGTRRPRRPGCVSPCLGLCDRAPAAMFTIAGEAPATFTRRARSTRSASSAALEATDGRRRPSAADAAGPATPDLAAPAPDRRRSTRPRSTTTGRTAATRPSPARSRSAPRRSSRRSPPRSSWAAAAPRSRPAASGPRSPPSRPSRTTSSATPTSRSRARSRTASCSRATRSRSSRR